MRAAATPLACLALAGAATALALGSAGEGEAQQSPLAAAATGSFSLVGSDDGMPIFTATNIAPGDSAGGTVEIANEGSEAVDVTLSQRDLTDVPGPGGGVLSQRLALRIEQTNPASSVYQGRLATMPPLALGQLAPGDSRAFEFVASLPDGGQAAAVENAVQGASTSVAYTWTARVAASPSPSPSPAPPPSPPTAAPAQLGVRIVGYRHTLRNGRLIAWARCNQPCRVRSRARLLAPGAPSFLRATARHAQERRFGARTRRLSLPLSDRQRRALWTSASRTARIVVVARNRDGESATASKLLHLRRSRTNR